MRLNYNSIYDKNNYHNKILFKGVSINEAEKAAKALSTAVRKKGIIEAAEKKIEDLISVDTNDISIRIQDITRQSNAKRQQVQNDFWNWRKEYHTAIIDKEEYEAKERLLRQGKKSTEEYADKIEEAKRLISETERQLKEQDPEKAIKQRRELEDIGAAQASIKAKRGFARIAGYEEEKAGMDKYYISKIKREQQGEDVDVPGGVLFFGPTGCGKTTFANAFAEQTGCPIEEVEFGGKQEIKDRKFIIHLNEIKQKAQEQFEKTRVRTIVLIDEIDSIINKKSSILKEFNNFLIECSKKFHCTVFATTNNPFRIALDMSKQTNFPYRFSLRPPGLNKQGLPDNSNIIAVLKHYLQPIASGELDYEQLAQRLKQKAGVEAFNNSQIEQELCANKKTLSQKELLARIDNEKMQPSITEEELQDFRKQEAKLMTHKVDL